MSITEQTPDSDPADLPDPESVRTPGRTWTTFNVDSFDTGSGGLTVDAPGSVETLMLEDAQEQYPEKVEQVLFRETDPQANTVAAAHAAQLDDAVFIRIPDGTVIDDLVYIETTAEDGFYPHHVLVYAEDGSTAEIVERNTGGAGCDSSFTEVVVGENATISYTKINALDHGKGYADNGVTVQEHGTFNVLLLPVGSDLYRNTWTANLAGPRSRYDYNLGFLAADEQHMDITTHVIHSADNTTCDMDSRGVALDRSRTVYKGVQEVMENAEGTKSFQDETTIMVGDDCEADTTPQLQIDNSDVEATHAATTGHIDDEALFYLKSRGVTENEAMREIITGMFDDLIEQSTAVGEDTIHQKIRETLG